MRIPPPGHQPWRPNATGLRHAVAAGHQLSAQAGLQILEAGGNAVDAGVAASLVTCVVESQMTGIAGIAPMVFRMAETGETLASSGIGFWPQAASCAYFQEKHGGRIPVGFEEAIVPGALGSLVAALSRFGTMSFSDVAHSAARFARDGFPMYALMARHIAERKDILPPSSVAVAMPGGKPPEAGDRFVQADLGRTFDYLIAEERAQAKGGREAGLKGVRDAFYEGDVAAQILAYHKENGGLLAPEDLAAFEADFSPAAEVTWRDVRVATGSTGGLHLLMLFNLLDGVELESLGHNTAAYIHTLAEAVKIAMADREAYIGDPAFVDVPTEAILDKAFAAKRRAHMDAAKAYPGFPPSAAELGEGPPIPRDPSQAAAPVEGGGAARQASGAPGDLATSIVCVIDAAGNIFTGMPSGSFLDAPLVPGTGIAVSAYGKLSTADPNHPNCVAPRKRPRCILPAIATRDDGLVMPFGSPGSDVIPQATLQVFLNIFAFGMDPQSAVEAPRFASYSFPQPFEPHEILDRVVRIEGRLGDDVWHGLNALGHKAEWWPKRDWLAASVCCILKDPDTGFLYAGADPRRQAWAVGF